MDSRVYAEIAAGGGLATAADLRAVGVDRRLLTAWVRSGQLVPVRRGVYTSRDLWESWDEHRDRPLARVRAVELTLAVPHVLSHDSAALVHDLPLLDPTSSVPHVTVRHLRASRTQSGVHHHAARYRDDEVVTVDGYVLLDVARTVADIARWHGYRSGLVAADGAMQRGVSRDELRAAAAAMVGWPYSLVAGVVVEKADPGAESAGETLSRELTEEAGLGPVETQFPVSRPGGIAWVDIRVGRHLIEFDGRVKYQGSDGEQALWDERLRQRELCAQGLGMSRLVWSDFWGAARDRAIERLQREEAVTRARFGTELSPQLAEFARRHRGRRYRAA